MNQAVTQFCKFLLVGGCSTGIHYSLLTLLVEAFRANVILATTVGFATAASFNYLCNRRFTFASHVRHFTAFPKFLTVALLGAAINASVIAWLEAHAELHYLMSQVFATLIVLFWNFTANAGWTFRRAK